ncbi:hypothetical protein, partial [Paraburkholderia kururiensis]|uniref:hypothetical protein n=1 Tax=Paraburkholderia kururiensis TaxID=984307 RepID=UPI001C3F14B7
SYAFCMKSRARADRRTRAWGGGRPETDFDKARPIGRSPWTWRHSIRSQIAEKNRSARSLTQQAGFENWLTAS